MKDITRVHLAKTPYSIEVEAKRDLAAYLGDIEQIMRADAEVMQEIEARVVELLAVRGVQAEGVIAADDVAAVRQQMGEPREFSEDGAAVDGGATEQKDDMAADQESPQPVRRLMRDTDHAWFGGVCAGIAAYLGVQPVWIRILAIISPFVSFGTSLLIYVILWLSVPAAQTAAEKLQMRGEAVTLAALKETTAGQSVAKGVTVVAKVFRFLLGTMLLIGTMGALIGLTIGSAVGLSVVTAMQGFVAQPWAWGLLISLMIGGMAAVWLGATLTYSAFSWTLKKPAIMSMITAVVVGALCISTTAIFGMRAADELARDEKRLTKVVALPLPAGSHELRTVENRAPYVSMQLRHTTEEPRAEVRYIGVGDAPAPQITLSREGSRLVVHGVENPQQCNSPFQFFTGGCYGSSPKVTVYDDKLRMEHGVSHYDDWDLRGQD